MFTIVLPRAFVYIVLWRLGSVNKCPGHWGVTLKLFNVYKQYMIILTEIYMEGK